jgi:hypothetical protein
MANYDSREAALMWVVEKGSSYIPIGEICTDTGTFFHDVTFGFCQHNLAYQQPKSEASVATTLATYLTSTPFGRHQPQDLHLNPPRLCLSWMHETQQNKL